uniref:Uncharacterized protein n=1 Tax=Globisporangium ultimum (strain ATCC 200006 / CBS 805.95 / DAOM BR144) TaxID=431595 RepID=K3WEP8_GLOUD
MTQVTKQYSLFQRSVRVVQMSVRRLDWWMLQKMPGLPNPPEVEAELRKPTFVDLWEFTMADHLQNVKDAWREYVASFNDPSDLDLEKSKQEIKDAARRLRGEVEDNTSKNLEFIGESLEGTQVLENLKELRATGEKNVAFLKHELEHAKHQIDTDAVVENVRSSIDEHRSKDDMVTTLSKNVDEIVDLVKTGRDAALRMEKEDMDAVKLNAQSWFADKLMVGQSVLLAFIAGYKEGKELELNREDALLITIAKQAAEEQKEVLKQQFDRIVADQRAKQQQEAQTRKAKEQEAESAHTDAKQAASQPER